MIRMLRASVPAGTLRLLICEAILLAVCLMTAAHLFALPGLFIYLADENGSGQIGVVIVIVMGTLLWRGVYIPQLRRPPYLFLFQELSCAFGVAFVAQGVFTYLKSDLRIPLRILVPGSALAMASLMLWHSLYGAVIWRSARRRVLFAGEGPLLGEAAAFLRDDPLLGLDVIGFVGPPAECGQPPEKWLGHLESLEEIVAATRPNLLVVGSEGRSERLTLPRLLEFRTAGVTLEEDFAFIEQVCRYLPLTALRPSRLIFGEEMNPRDNRFTEAVSFAVAGIVLLLALPVLLVAALAVRLSSRGPVLERRPRVGKDGHVFNLYSFRCVRAGSGALTVPGRLLRRWTVEEWPRLLNVLRGEMSLVGPRPERPEFVDTLARHIPFYRQRHVVRPGLTGWAQILYRPPLEDSFERLQYDLYYIKYRSVILNNYVILRFIRDLLDPA